MESCYYKVPTLHMKYGIDSASVSRESNLGQKEKPLVNAKQNMEEGTEMEGDRLQPAMW